MIFQEKFKKWQELINSKLKTYLPDPQHQPTQLHLAMNHSMNAGGKRLRPILAIAAHELFPSDTDPVPVGIALECIHTYSLIHDDLPAMDDSDLRRGQPTCHKKFDEATAILAGDAFQPLAFEVLSTAYRDIPEVVVDLVAMLASTAGSLNLVGGQMQDLICEGSIPTEEMLQYIHSKKTAAMIRTSLQMGFRLGMKGDNKEMISLIGEVGESIGLAFQAVDDLLDVSSTTSELGKDAHRDNESGKVTWVSLKGEEEARQLAYEHTKNAEKLLSSVGGDSTFLVQLINYMLKRSF